MKVRFLIRSLQPGGTERQCVALAKGLRKLGHDVGVFVFYPGGDLHHQLVTAGIPVQSLEKRRRWDLIGFWGTLRSHLQRDRPHILYSLLQVSNIVGALIKLAVPPVRVIWGLRSAVMDLKYYDWLVRLSYRLEPRLSSLADLIIVNSHAGFQHAKAGGYTIDRMMVIPNGVDVDMFAPDRRRGKTLRSLWGVQEEELLIGLVGRLDPIKDHSTFLRTAAIVARQCSQAKFVCVGGGDRAYKDLLLALSKDLEVAARVIWAGECHDMPAVYAALDVACLTSIAEGCPNVLLEAMACGVPCVATDVGDSKWIIGDTGDIVRSGDPDALAEALLRILQMDEADRMKQGHRSRDRILQHFSLECSVLETSRALQGIA